MEYLFSIGLSSWLYTNMYLTIKYIGQLVLLDNITNSNVYENSCKWLEKKQLEDGVNR